MNFTLVKKISLLLFFVLAASFVSAQSVATVNGNPVDAQEFLWVYKKNHPQQTKFSYEELENYLTRYLNFKLKVAEARDMKLDLDSAYIEEIARYEKALKEQKKLTTQAKEFGYIMNEYREGILMFNISEQMIWNKAQNDEQKLQTFYADNLQKYEGKKFGEIRGQVVDDYQQHLEADWIKVLRTKYPLTINSTALQKLVEQ